MEPYMNTVIAALAALGGSFVTGLFQYLNSKKDLDKLRMQLKAEIVSKQRQEWMDSLRERAIDLLAEYDQVFLLITDQENDNQEKLIDLRLSTSKNVIFIQLQLNPKKPEQQEVIEAITKMTSLFHYAPRKIEEDYSRDYDGFRKEYISSLNNLFGQTWQKVKKFE